MSGVEDEKNIGYDSSFNAFLPGLQSGYLFYHSDV